MPRLTILIVAMSASIAAMSSSTFPAEIGDAVSAPDPARYSVPDLVEALASNTVDLMRSKDESVNAMAKNYLNAFAVALDLECNFLTPASKEKLRDLAEADFLKRSDLATDLVAAMRLGTHDAKILAEGGCTKMDAIGAMVTLAQNLR